MKIKKNKKGSHVGIILSFTIFVTSLIFIVNIFSNVVDTEIDKKDKLELLENNLIFKMSKDVYVVNVYDETSNNCSKINTPSLEFDSYNVLSVDLHGVEFGSSIDGATTIFEGGKGFSKLYYFDEGFTKNVEFSYGVCQDIQIKNIQKQKLILESKIFQLIGEINNSYEELKNELGVGIEDEFNVIFVDSQGNVYTKPERDLRTDVFSKEKLIKYVDSSGKEKTGSLIIKIW